MYFMYNNDQYGFHIDLQDFCFYYNLKVKPTTNEKFQDIKMLTKNNIIVDTCAYKD